MSKKQVTNQQSPKKIITPLENEEWYQNFIEECRAIIVETGFNARMELIKQKWLLGERVLKEYENFERKKVYGKEIVQRVAESLKISSRDLWYCIQFTKQYPKLVEELEISLDFLPEGKNVSWRKIINKYLPEPKSKEEGKCPHSEIEEVSFLRCKNCKENLGGHTRTLSKKELAETLRQWAETRSFFPFQINKKEAPVPFILSGKKEWENFLKNEFRTVPELWKLWKKIENKKT